MRRKITKKTDQFKVYDSNENIYLIIEYTDYEEAKYFGPPSKLELVELLKSYKTSDGDCVNKIDKNNFEILQMNPRTGEYGMKVHK
jgi:hypothetical protein